MIQEIHEPLLPVTSFYGYIWYLVFKSYISLTLQKTLAEFCTKTHKWIHVYKVMYVKEQFTIVMRESFIIEKGS